jgi:lysophospholipase L1-like esterase
MKVLRYSTVLAVALLMLATRAVAQPNPPAAAAMTAPAEATVTNAAIIPVPRTDRATNRQELVLQRARENPGECDIVFIGDSIMQGWEGPGRRVWTNYYGNRKCLNLGVGGDRTQHVLWRFEQGQLDGLKPKAAVLMIGTNNSNNKDNTEAEILEGVVAIVNQIRERLPDTKLLLFGIFPRGRTFSTQRGKILQVNEVLAKLADDNMIFYYDIGPQLIESDGSIARQMMGDALHPGARGYEIWAEAMEPKLKEILSN